MSIEIRACPLDAFRQFAETAEAPFGDVPSADAIAAWGRLLPEDRRFAAYDGEAMVGTSAAFTLEVSVPGGTLTAAGVTGVGVLPSHRRQGILTRLMRRQLDDARERREPLALLWASEGAIYPHFGYGLASQAVELSIERTRAAFARPVGPAGSFRLLSPAQALETLPAVYDAARECRPGMLVRTGGWWIDAILRDPPDRREGAGPLTVALYEREGLAEGYAIYRHRPSWDARGPKGELQVREVVTISDEAVRDTWSWLFQHDLITTVTARRLPPDHALWFLLAEPRRAGFTAADGLWSRILDVSGALAGRAYATQGTIVLEVADSFCPWNAGRWQLAAGGDSPEVTATDAPPDIALDIADLATLHFGGFSARQLAAAGRVEERRPGGLALADLLFGWPVAPWCAEVF